MNRRRFPQRNTFVQCACPHSTVFRKSLRKFSFRQRAAIGQEPTRAPHNGASSLLLFADVQIGTRILPQAAHCRHSLIFEPVIRQRRRLGVGNIDLLWRTSTFIAHKRPFTYLWVAGLNPLQHYPGRDPMKADKSLDRSSNTLYRQPFSRSTQLQVQINLKSRR